MIRFDLPPSSWDEFGLIAEQLVMRHRARRVCEVGGGANPAIDLAFVEKQNIDYVIMDVSASELSKAPAGYMTVQADIATERLGSGDFDLVLSRMVAEHVSDGKQFHRNVYELLREGGRAFHFFPTLYAFPFLVNKVLPEAITERVLRRLDPGRAPEGRHAKFPTHYDWCRGPTTRQLERLRRSGFELEEYVGFFGHDYYMRFPRLHRLEMRKAAYLVKHPRPSLTSYAYVFLRRV
jgi:SAM-dependent methyltransferase